VSARTPERHGEFLSEPFRCDDGRERVVVAFGVEWWVAFKHPDGQWVSEAPFVLVGVEPAEEPPDA
jgi:hypothetical protein